MNIIRSFIFPTILFCTEKMKFFYIYTFFFTHCVLDQINSNAFSPFLFSFSFENHGYFFVLFKHFLFVLLLFLFIYLFLFVFFFILVYPVSSQNNVKTSTINRIQLHSNTLNNWYLVYVYRDSGNISVEIRVVCVNRTRTTVDFRIQFIRQTISHDKVIQITN